MPENDERSTSSLMPHIVVSDGAAAIDFYKRAFNAREVARHLAPDGKRIMHATLIINGAHLMLNDDFPEFMGGKSSTPEVLGGSPVTLHLQVEKADPVFEQAVQAGATVRFPLDDQFWGDRYGQVTDPFGHIWSIGSAIRKVSEEDLAEGAKKHFV